MSNSKDNNREDAELASLWGQHEICPECRGTGIKEIDERVRVLFFHSYHVKKYICNDCGCKWM
ncbi:MAG: hypothetical protein E7254_05245 [Lachnospiraceae bacterium]|nr:hypothetical protein [Lachnospiraceae bacterium]